jgi:hypothetical protein
MCFTLNFLFFDAILMTMRVCYLSLLLSPIRARYYVKMEYAFWIERSGGGLCLFFSNKMQAKEERKNIKRIFTSIISRETLSPYLSHMGTTYTCRLWL